MSQKQGKKYVAASKQVEVRPYAMEEAVPLIKKVKFAKFDETVELHVRLGVVAEHLLDALEVLEREVLHGERLEVAVARNAVGTALVRHAAERPGRVRKHLPHQIHRRGAPDEHFDRQRSQRDKRHVHRHRPGRGGDRGAAA